MRLCFVVDARSPIAQNWIRYFIDQGHDVHVISSYPCSPDALPDAKLQVVPLGLAGLSRIQHDGGVSSNAPSTSRKNPLRPLLAQMRSGHLSFVSDFVLNWLVPLDLHRQARLLRKHILEIQPDLVHAMRIPREGVSAALAAPKSIPLIVSVWGNDFTLWARRNPIRARQTKIAVERADALHCDCWRDMRLAIDWGFDRDLPSLVVPGAGGVHLDLFYPDDSRTERRKHDDIPEEAVVILNPRGIRGYVRNDIFFAALADVVNVCPNVHVLCTGMKGNPVVEGWIARGNLQPWITLLPKVPHSDMADLYRLADISVSLSEHDGTPNSLLEAMASGCFVVAGDVESVREWITPAKNGLLCDATDKKAVAQTMIQAIQQTDQRTRAATANREIVESQADYRKIMPQVQQFYERVISRRYRSQHDTEKTTKL